MGKWVWAFLTEYTAHILFGGVGLGAMILSWFADLPIYVILLLAMGTIVLMFLGINQIHAFRERHKKGFSTQSDDEIEATLRKWLDKYQFSTADKPIKEALFRFTIEDSQKRLISVYRPRDHAGILRVMAILHSDILLPIPEAKRAGILLVIGVEMARLGVYYGPAPLVTVHEDLPCDDSLTEYDFINVVKRIRQALVVIGAHISVALASLQEQIETTEQVPDKKDSQS